MAGVFKSVLDADSYGLLALWDQIYYAQGVLSGYGGYVLARMPMDPMTLKILD